MFRMQIDGRFPVGKEVDEVSGVLELLDMIGKRDRGSVLTLHSVRVLAGRVAGNVQNTLGIHIVRTKLTDKLFKTLQISDILEEIRLQIHQTGQNH